MNRSNHNDGYQHSVDHAQYLDDLAYLAAADARDRAELLRRLVGDGAEEGNGPRRVKRAVIASMNRRFDDWAAEKERKAQERAARQHEKEDERAWEGHTCGPGAIHPTPRRRVAGAVGAPRDAAEGRSPTMVRHNGRQVSPSSSFQAEMEKWASERDEKIDRARRAMADAREREEQAMIGNQRDSGRWVSAESRRILQERQRRLREQASHDTSCNSNNNEEKERVGEAEEKTDVPLIRSSGHILPSGANGGDLPLARGQPSCHRRCRTEGDVATFTPTLSPRTRALAKRHQSLWKRTGSARRKQHPSEESAADAESDVPLTPAMLDWLTGKKLSREAEQDLVERLYGRSATNSDKAAGGAAPGEEEEKGRPLSATERAAIQATLFKQNMRLLARQQAKLAQREEQKRNAFYEAAPFSPRIEVFVRDRDWKGQRISVPSHLAADWARRRYGSVAENTHKEGEGKEVGRGRRPRPSTAPTSPSPSPRSTAATGCAAFLDRQAYYEDRKARQLAKEAAKRQEAQREQERATCTFTPELSSRSRRLARRLFRDMSRQDDEDDSAANATALTMASAAPSSSALPSPVPRRGPQPRRRLTVSPHPLSAPSAVSVPRGEMPCVSPRQLRIDNRQDPANPLNYTDLRDLRLVVSPAAGRRGQRPRRTNTTSPAAHRPSYRGSTRTNAADPRPRERWPSQRRRIVAVPVDSDKSPRSGLSSGCSDDDKSWERQDGDSPLPTGRSPGAFPHPCVYADLVKWMRAPSPAGAALAGRDTDGTPDHGLVEHTKATPPRQERQKRPIVVVPRRDVPLLLADSSSTSPPPPQHPDRSGDAESSAAASWEGGIDGRPPPQTIVSELSHDTAAADEVTVSSSPAPLPGPLADAATLLSLSHWWVELVEAHLVHDGERDAEVESSAPSTLTAVSPFAFPLHRSSLGRETGSSPEGGAEAGREPSQNSDAAAETSGLWLRKAVLASHSPFEVALPLSLVARALSRLLTCEDGEGEPGGSRRGTSAGRRLVVAEEEGSIRRRSRQMGVAGSGGSDDDGHARDMSSSSSAAPRYTCSHRLYLRGGGQSVALQRCPIVLYNNKVLFREFIRLYEWLLPLL